MVIDYVQTILYVVVYVGWFGNQCLMWPGMKQTQHHFNSLWINKWIDHNINNALTFHKKVHAFSAHNNSWLLLYLLFNLFINSSLTLEPYYFTKSGKEQYHKGIILRKAKIDKVALIVICFRKGRTFYLVKVEIY